MPSQFSLLLDELTEAERRRDRTAGIRCSRETGRYLFRVDLVDAWLKSEGRALILDALVKAEIAIEVAHRAKRRLFALQGLDPLRHVVQPPYRPDPNRGRGRPRLEIDGDIPGAPPLPLPPLSPIERKAFDYTALEEAMAHLDAVVRSSRVALRSLAEGRTGTRAEPAADSAEAAPNC